MSVGTGETLTMGLGAEARSLLEEAWAGARRHLVIILRNAMVCGSYLIVAKGFEVILRIFPPPPDDYASKLGTMIISYAELSFLALFLIRSILDEFRDAMGKLK